LSILNRLALLSASGTALIDKTAKAATINFISTSQHHPDQSLPCEIANAIKFQTIEILLLD